MKPSPESNRRFFAFVGKAVIGALVAFAVLEFVFWAAWSLGHWLHPDPLRPQVSPAYAGATWVDEFHREQVAEESRFAYFPFRVTGVLPWHGKYINNDEHSTGVWRRTMNPDNGQCQKQPVTKVWVFGGSTVYGSGVPDWATVPSYLSHSLNGDGRACVDVTNFGAPAYVSTQDLILLTEQLKRGARPDIVIFYDGVNDTETGMRAADPWNTFNGLGVIRPRAEGSIQGRLDFVRRFYTMQVFDAGRRLFSRQRGSLSDEHLRAKAITVVDNYEANLNIASALAHAYNFKLYAFWQPMLLYGHKPLVSFEQRIAQLDATGGVRVDGRAFVTAYQEAERRAPEAGFVSMAGVFDSVSEPVYVDEVHLGPRGNELVADAIAKYLGEHPAGMEFRRR